MLPLFSHSVCALWYLVQAFEILLEAFLHCYFFFQPLRVRIVIAGAEGVGKSCIIKRFSSCCHLYCNVNCIVMPIFNFIVMEIVNCIVMSIVNCIVMSNVNCIVLSIVLSFALYCFINRCVVYSMYHAKYHLLITCDRYCEKRFVAKYLPTIGELSQILCTKHPTPTNYWFNKFSQVHLTPNTKHQLPNTNYQIPAYQLLVRYNS